MHFRCPNCNHPIELIGSADDKTVDHIDCPSCESGFSFAETGLDETEIGSDRRVGHFLLECLLGKGGFGQVYRAKDESLQRTVAIKIPWSHNVDNDSSASVLKEARAAAIVQHPNVVKVYEVGALDRGLYIVSEYIDGLDLSRWLNTEEVSPREAAELMARICDGVQAAHDAGVVHRDLKPGNILVSSQGVPMVTDFGLAQRKLTGQATVTRTGEIFGTPKYMSPEQASGKTKLVDHRSDIFSLGVILYQMLVGRPPFEAEGNDRSTLLYKIINKEPKSPRKENASLHRDIETVCLKCLQKAREARYQSAADLAEDLRQYAAGRPVKARPVSRIEKSWRLVKRWPTTSAAVIVAVVMAATATVLAIQPDPEPEVLREQVVVAPADVEYATRIAMLRADGEPITNCRWAIFPLDSYTAKPVLSKAMRIEDKSNLNVSLKPGDYYFVALIPDYGFHEVHRTIPEDPETAGLTAGLSHLQWEWDEATETFMLPPITVPVDEPLKAMTLLPAGDFVFGDPQFGHQKRTETVEAFWIGNHEVTKAEVAAIPGSSFAPQEINGDGDHAAGFLSLHQARALAERAGCRLLTEIEFECAATNYGTTDVPNGKPDTYTSSKPSYGPVSTQSWDRMLNYPVTGLNSGVAEWTASTMAMHRLPHERRIEPQMNKLLKISEGHVVKGGLVEEGKSIPDSHPDSGRDRLTRSDATYEPELGFRLGRSTLASLEERYFAE